MQKTLFNYPNLDIRSASVFDLVFHNIDDTNTPKLNKWAKVAGVKLGWESHTGLRVSSLLNLMTRFWRTSSLLSSRGLHWDFSFGRDTYWYCDTIALSREKPLTSQSRSQAFPSGENQ